MLRHAFVIYLMRAPLMFADAAFFRRAMFSAPLRHFLR